jgi:hypothetical protein
VVVVLAGFLISVAHDEIGSPILVDFSITFVLEPYLDRFWAHERAHERGRTDLVSVSHGVARLVVDPRLRIPAAIGGTRRAERVDVMPGFDPEEKSISAYLSLGGA